MFSWPTLKRPIIGLSPMADMTDLPFCTVVREVNGARGPYRSPIIFREMVSSEAIVRENTKTLDMARFDPVERPLIQQLFGADPEVMARAAAIIMERFAPDGIDINMGCPVYKLTNNFNGAALMKEPDRAAEIVRAIKSVIGNAAPVSVKIRLGWSDPTQAREFSCRLEDAGADLITVHGRTKCQAYSGRANWAEIGEIKKRVSIPVLANGDIVDALTAQQALALSRCDGVMIGRGSLGNPWVFGEIAEVLLHDRHPELVSGSLEMLKQVQHDDVIVQSLSKKIPIILEHARRMEQHYGSHGIVLFRKHLSWYLKRIPNTKPLRMQLMLTRSMEEIQQSLMEFSSGTYSNSIAQLPQPH